MNTTLSTFNDENMVPIVVIALLIIVLAIDISSDYFPLFSLLATFSIFLFILFLKRPEWGLLCTVASLPLSSIIIFENAGITKIVGLIAFIAWLAAKMVRGLNLRSTINWQTACFVAFFLISVASCLRVGDSDSRTLLLRIFLGLGLFLFASEAINSWKFLERVLLFLMLAGVFVSILNIVLYHLGFQGTSVYQDVQVSVDRIEGMGFSPNNMAKLMLFLLTLGVFMPFPSSIRRFRWIGLSILFVIMILTYSRGALVGLLAVLCTYAVYHREKRALLISLCLGGLVFYLAPESYLIRISSIFSPEEQGLRPLLWHASLFAILQKPIFGWGLGQSMYAIHDQGFNIPKMLEAHNTALDILLSEGVVGFIPFALTAVFGVSYLFRSLKIAEKELEVNEYSCLKAIFYGYIAYWSAAMFMNLTFDPLLYFLMGLCPVALKLTMTPRRS